MTKRLTLMRHAKSSWEDYALSDFDRPLAPRGKKAAPKMGQYLYEQYLVPDLVLCSSANRTRETLARVQTTLPGDYEIQFDRSIYSAGMGDGILNLLSGVASDVNHVLVVGHNPSMQEMALNLTNWQISNQDHLHHLQRKFSTGGVASMVFGIESWSEVAGGRGELTHFMVPKML